MHERLFGGAGLVFALFGMVAMARPVRRRKKLLYAALALALLVALIACGGTTKSSTPTPGPNPSPSPSPSPTPAPAGGTPAGKYTVTVNAVTGTVQHSANYVLTVQ